jgi:hypothetical protein
VKSATGSYNIILFAMSSNGFITGPCCSDTFIRAPPFLSHLALLLPPDPFLVGALATFYSSLLNGSVFGMVGQMLDTSQRTGASYDRDRVFSGELSGLTGLFRHWQ